MSKHNDSPTDFLKALNSQMQANAPANHSKSNEAPSPAPKMILKKPPKSNGVSLNELFKPKEVLSNAAIKPELVERIEEAVFRRINLLDLDDSPYQPRLQYREDFIGDLAVSMAAVGQQEPIIVRPLDNGRFQLVSGHCRSRAARNLQWEDIKAMVVPMSDQEAFLAASVSNVARSDLSDYERAKMFNNLLEKGVCPSKQAVAQKMGISPGRVSQVSVFMELDDSIRSILDIHPDLIHYRTADDIKGLWEKYPLDRNLILDEIQRLIVDASAKQSSLKSCFMRQFSLKHKVKHHDPVIDVIGLDHGSACKITATDKNVSIKLMAGSPLSSTEIQQIVANALQAKMQELANQAN